MNLNKVFIIGRLTADPQLRTTPGGQSVTTLGVATNRVWTDRGGARQEETEFHSVVVWGKQAEIVNQFLKKGSMVFIEGRLQTRSWQDKQGQNRKTTEIVSERIQLGPRASGEFSRGQSKGRVSEEQAPSQEEIPTVDLEGESKETTSEDLPF